MDKNAFSSFLLGLGVGVGLGMLFAPKSGPETRDYIRNKANEGTDYLKQRTEDMRQNASQWVDRGRDGSGPAGVSGHRESAPARGPRITRITPLCRTTCFG
jgi:gas vesicle protein